MVSGVPVRAREVSFLTAVIVVAIIVAVGGDGCRRAYGPMSACVSLKMRESLRVRPRVAVR